MNVVIFVLRFIMSNAKGLVAELAPPHAQSAWDSRGGRVQAARLAVCCNYI